MSVIAFGAVGGFAAGRSFEDEDCAFVMAGTAAQVETANAVEAAFDSVELERLGWGAEAWGGC